MSNVSKRTRTNYLCLWWTIGKDLLFLDAIASLEFGYESKKVCVIKPNNGYIAKHGAIIEYTLNVY